MIPFPEPHVTVLRALQTVWGSERFIVIGAAADAVPVDFVPGATVRVASLRSLVVLKVAAYLDRPRERDSDLADVAHILSEFVGLDADERWSDEIINLGMDFDDVSPFVAGKQIGGLVDEPERGLINRFLAAIEDPADPVSTLHRMAQRAPAAWRDPERLHLRLTAFGRGFESSCR